MMKNCKITETKVEVLDGICEMSDECFANGVKCHYVPKNEEEREIQSQRIKKICEIALKVGHF